MTESGSLESVTPLGPVNADDLKRVWHLIHNVSAIGREPSSGIDARLITLHCEPGADAPAVFFRAALLQYLFQEGLLDDWRDGDELTDPVFQLGASFPIEQGVQGFDPASFIKSLPRA